MVTKYQQANKIPILLVRLNLVEGLAQIPNCHRIGLETAKKVSEAAGQRKGSSDGRYGEGNRRREVPHCRQMEIPSSEG